ncbi:peroxiredoxin family protein [Saccharicrinis aurantiacus]|uniref:peroxiredoxin family protein n=1 Tax=Saccharicrinis aurantiacus TaxID=1849719 RepID=UPI0008398AB8|nr:redoxin domain-containing protein [Saccharicrinis aurantiacus]
MKLFNGSKAIDFITTDINGKTVKLSDYKGKKIILSFFRNVNCPYCNRQVHQLITSSKRIKETGAEIIFFFESSADKLTSSTFHQGISPWPLISDSEKVIYQKYGIEKSTLKMMKTMFVSSLGKAKKDTEAHNLPEDKEATLNLIPADFLIDENFNIVKAHYGKHLDDHLTIDEIKEFVGIVNPFKKKTA